jgi:predicted DNA-binding antitoxin AbrB/MazE fold protein
MTITVRAIYESGVLRPIEPLKLPEGEAVDVTIATTQAAAPSVRAPIPEAEDYRRRIPSNRRVRAGPDDLGYALMIEPNRCPAGSEEDGNPVADHERPCVVDLEAPTAVQIDRENSERLQLP